jgi:hypothetical protein
MIMSNNIDIPTVLRKIEKVNHKKTIKIRYRKLISGTYSLYFDMWFNGRRVYQFLKIYIIGKNETRIADKEKIQIAIAIRDKKELELLQEKAGFQLFSWKSKANFVQYFKAIADSQSPKDRVWKSVYSHLNIFSDGKISFANVDTKFCQELKDYFLSRVTPNAAKIYFGKIKASLNKAVKEKIIKNNPAAGITVKSNETFREFLIFEEIQILKDTHFDNMHTKNAFLC